MVSTSVLGEDRAIEILMALSEGPKHVRLLHREIGGSTTTIELRLERLMQSGLIREAKGSSPARKIFELTDHGRSMSTVLRWLSTPKMKPGFSNILQGPIEWILILLYSLGRIRGSTRLEKLLFLLKEEFKAVREPFYEFVPYLFGPFSAQILNDAKILSEAKLIEIEQEAYETPELSDWLMIRKTYKLTEAGKEVAKRLYERMSQNSEVKRALWQLKEFNTMPLSHLLQSIYQKYPQYTQEDSLA